jgi:acetyl-CoA carboxylase carboxyltransferase component
MGMKEYLAELKARRQKALEQGGEERVEKQHGRSKLTARERLSLLLDDGSFQEFGQLASHLGQHGKPQKVDEIAPADGVVTGFGTISGRPICVAAEDFTVLGGTFGIVHGKKKLRAIETAIRERTPVVWIQDGAGARAQEMIGEGLPEGPHYLAMARHSGSAPQVAVVAGPSAGDSSLIASLCEFIVMVEGTSMLAAGGPPVVKAATGQDIGKEELGGASIHTRLSGVADNAAKDDADAVSQAKRFLSFLPSNAWQWPPHVPCSDPVSRADQELLTIVPDDPRHPYDMKRIVHSVLDRDSFFEIGALHAPMIVTGFARMDGHSVGVVANQPIVQAGAIIAPAARKARHFIDLCNAYHIPLLFLVDVPGMMPGPQSEREGTLRPGLALTYSLAWTEVPRIVVVIRKAFGYGAVAMGGGGNSGQLLTLAWPGAVFGSLPATSAVLAAHARKLEEATDRQALERELIDNYNRSAGAFHAAAKANIDDVIDPRETRMRVAAALALSRNRRNRSPEPVSRRGVMP